MPTETEAIAAAAAEYAATTERQRQEYLASEEALRLSIAAERSDPDDEITEQEVTTYQLAYVAGEVDLCSDHGPGGAREKEASDRLGVTGPVSHGRHGGTCDACSAE